MKDTPLSSRELALSTPDRTKVVERLDDQSYHISVWTVREHTVNQTSAQTYNNSTGHYFISKNDAKHVVEKIDTLIDDYVSNFPEVNALRRRPKYTYELYIQTPNDKSLFSEKLTPEELQLLFNHDSNYALRVDDIVDNLKELL